jgi:hypothetical protein
MTGLKPDDRLAKHKAGLRANKFVRLYGQRLLPELYEGYNPMPYEAAREMEVELAIGLAGVKRWVHEATLDKFARLVILEVVETRRAGASRAPARLFTHDPAYLFLAVGHHDY